MHLSLVFAVFAVAAASNPGYYGSGPEQYVNTEVSSQRQDNGYGKADTGSYVREINYGRDGGYGGHQGRSVEYAKSYNCVRKDSYASYDSELECGEDYDTFSCDIEGHGHGHGHGFAGHGHAGAAYGHGHAGVAYTTSTTYGGGYDGAYGDNHYNTRRYKRDSGYAATPAGYTERTSDTSYSRGHRVGSGYGYGGHADTYAHGHSYGNVDSYGHGNAHRGSYGTVTCYRGATPLSCESFGYGHDQFKCTESGEAHVASTSAGYGHGHGGYGSGYGAGYSNGYGHGYGGYGSRGSYGSYGRRGRGYGRRGYGFGRRGHGRRYGGHRRSYGGYGDYSSY